MGKNLSLLLRTVLSGILIFQLAGCGTLLYPERRGQVGGRLDVGIVVLDAIGLLFFLIPGIIAFAVDFSNGTIYLPARRAVVTEADLIQIKFDPKHTTLAQIEKMIKDKTGYSVKLAQGNTRIRRMRSGQEMITEFKTASADLEQSRLALNR